MSGQNLENVEDASMRLWLAMRVLRVSVWISGPLMRASIRWLFLFRNYRTTERNNFCIIPLGTSRTRDSDTAELLQEEKCKGHILGRQSDRSCPLTTSGARTLRHCGAGLKL